MCAPCLRQQNIHRKIRVRGHNQRQDHGFGGIGVVAMYRLSDRRSRSNNNVCRDEGFDLDASSRALSLTNVAAEKRMCFCGRLRCIIEYRMSTL